MLCATCGAEKIENANFCVKCGYQFSQDLIEKQKDDYLINYGLSTIVGLGSGILTGIVSAAASQTLKLEWWGWAIILVFASAGIGILLYTSFKTLENALIRQRRRNS